MERTSGIVAEGSVERSGLRNVNCIVSDRPTALRRWISMRALSRIDASHTPIRSKPDAAATPRSSSTRAAPAGPAGALTASRSARGSVAQRWDETRLRQQFHRSQFGQIEDHGCTRRMIGADRIAQVGHHAISAVVGLEHGAICTVDDSGCRCRCHGRTMPAGCGTVSTRQTPSHSDFS
jgi:hypothetical protein